MQTVPNAASAPQDPIHGLEITAELRSLQIRIARLRRLEMYSKLHGGNPQQQLEWAALEHRIASKTLSVGQLENLITTQESIFRTAQG